MRTGRQGRLSNQKRDGHRFPFPHSTTTTLNLDFSDEIDDEMVLGSVASDSSLATELLVVRELGMTPAARMALKPPARARLSIYRQCWLLTRRTILTLRR